MLRLIVTKCIHVISVNKLLCIEIYSLVNKMIYINSLSCIVTLIVAYLSQFVENNELVIQTVWKSLKKMF